VILRNVLDEGALDCYSAPLIIRKSSDSNGEKRRRQAAVKNRPTVAPRGINRGDFVGPCSRDVDRRPDQESEVFLSRMRKNDGTT
jgi:hypothetical protein